MNNLLIIIIPTGHHLCETKMDTAYVVQSNSLEMACERAFCFTYIRATSYKLLHA